MPMYMHTCMHNHVNHLNEKRNPLVTKLQRNGSGVHYLVIGERNQGRFISQTAKGLRLREEGLRYIYGEIDMER